MKGFRDIEKALKKDAERFLPDSSLKDGIRARLIDCASSTETDNRARIEVANMSRVKRAPRRVVYSAIAACLVVCMGLGLGLGFGLGLQSTDSTVPVYGDTYIAIDINPSFGITAAVDGTVKEVVALNEDAALVIFDENFEGKNADEVCARIAELSLELGYLSEGGEIVVTACNDNATLQSDVATAIRAKITESTTLSAINVNINLVSGGKSALIDKAVAAGAQEQSFIDKTAAEVNAVLNRYDKESISAYIEGLTAEYTEELNALRSAALNLHDALTAYQDNPSAITLAPVITNGFTCFTLYNLHYGVDINIQNIDSYFSDFYNFVDKVKDGGDVSIEAEIRGYVKLQVKLSFDD